ncbi:MAG: alpha/beta fold hydrolase [Planctomycetota bacterium]|nr:alpha/beta fold hydrolase [Planctomycetota bacterium]
MSGSNPLQRRGLPLLLMAIVVSPGCHSVKSLSEAGYSLPYDPETGIVRGAEPIRIERDRTRACLLVHGWLSSPADFADLPKALDELGWDVHAPLHPGHGSRPADVEGVTADTLLEQIRDEYSKLRGRYAELVLIGASMGGAVSTILAAESAPDRLVLIAPFYEVTYHWYYLIPLRWWAALIPDFLLKPGPRAAMERVEVAAGVEGPLVYNAAPGSSLDLLFELRRRAVHDAEIERLTMPTLVIYSKSDDRASPSAIEAFFERLPAGPKTIVALPGSSHYLFHDSEGGEVIETIKGFLGPPER